MAKSNLIYPELIDRVINIPADTPSAVDNVLIAGQVSLRNIISPQIGMMLLALSGSTNESLTQLLSSRAGTLLFKVSDVFGDDAISGDSDQWFVNEFALVPIVDRDASFIIALLLIITTGNYDSNSIKINIISNYVLDADHLQSTNNWSAMIDHPLTVCFQYPE